MERHETNGVRAEGGLCLVHAWELSAVPRHFVLLSLGVLFVVAASLLLVTRGVGMGLALGHVLGRKRDMLVRHLGMATFGTNAEVMRLVKELVRKKELGRLIKGSSTLALGVPHVLKAGIVHHGVNDGRITDRIIDATMKVSLTLWASPKAKSAEESMLLVLVCCNQKV